MPILKGHGKVSEAADPVQLLSSTRLEIRASVKDPTQVFETQTIITEASP